MGLWTHLCGNGRGHRNRNQGLQQPLFLPGDLNCDALVNTDDIPPFVLALTDPAAYQAAYPGCDPNRVDLNASGTADGDDIQAFVDLLLLP